MPLFEYRCDACGHVTTFLEKAGARSAHPCEECGSRKTNKVFSTFAAQSGGTAAAAAPPCGNCTNDCRFAGGN